MISPFFTVPLNKGVSEMILTTTPPAPVVTSHAPVVVIDAWSLRPVAGIIPSVQGFGWDEDREEVEERLRSLEDRYPELRRPR